MVRPLFFLLLSMWCSAAGAAVPLTWMVVDFPPIFAGGPDHSGDLQLRFLISHMPGFEHHVMSGSVARSFYALQHGDGVCKVSAVMTPERQAYAVFSRRAMPYPGFRMVVRAADLARYSSYRDGAGKVDLVRLARASGLIGGFTGSRHYGGAIQSFLDAPDRRPALERLVDTRQLLELLHGGRIDFIFAMPVEAEYFSARLGRPDEFALLAVAGMPSVVEGHVACSRGPIGERAIAAIDAALAPERNWEEFVAPVRRWLDPADYERIVGATGGRAADPR